MVLTRSAFWTSVHHMVKPQKSMVLLLLPNISHSHGTSTLLDPNPIFPNDPYVTKTTGLPPLRPACEWHPHQCPHYSGQQISVISSLQPAWLAGCPWWALVWPGYFSALCPPMPAGDFLTGFPVLHKFPSWAMSSTNNMHWGLLLSTPVKSVQHTLKSASNDVWATNISVELRWAFCRSISQLLTMRDPFPVSTIWQSHTVRV